MPRDLSPLLPAKVTVYYRGRRCSGAPSDSVPAWYKSEVLLSTIALTDLKITPRPAGVPSVTRIIHSTALALYAPGGGTPTNQSTLDTLTTQIAQDFYDWRSASFDIAYNGIINPRPSGLVDLVTFDEADGTLCTRVQSQAWDGEPEELQHQDPAAAGCTDANNSGAPVEKVPRVTGYAPPETCLGGGGTVTLTVSGGAITAISASGGTFTSTPTLAISGDGDGTAAGTLTLSGTALSGGTITNGGSGYSSAIGSTRGGGAKLQRTLYDYAIEDGRLVKRFVQYDTIG